MSSAFSKSSVFIDRFHRIRVDRALGPVYMEVWGTPGRRGNLLYIGGVTRLSI